MPITRFRDYEPQRGLYLDYRNELLPLIPKTIQDSRWRKERLLRT